jgi:hypothetical protein
VDVAELHFAVSAPSVVVKIHQISPSAVNAPHHWCQPRRIPLSLGAAARTLKGYSGVRDVHFSGHVLSGGKSL